MNTMRSMAAAVTAASALLVLGACGGSGGDPGVTPSAPPPAATTSATTPTLVERAQTTPLEAWLPESARILNSLTSDLNDLSDAITTNPSGLADDPSVAALENDAKDGIALRAPAGHPALDTAWDAVMNDCLLVAGDFRSGDLEQAADDLHATGTDMDHLQAVSDAL